MSQLSIPSFSKCDITTFDHGPRIWLAPGHAPGQKLSERERYEKALAPEWPDVHIRRPAWYGQSVVVGPGWLVWARDVWYKPYISVYMNERVVLCMSVYIYIYIYHM